MKNKMMTVEMPDGSVWAVPVMVIARNRADYYKGEFGGDIEVSLNEDTLPAFRADSYEIEDWASNNMNWEDVEEHAKRLETSVKNVDYQEGWMNGEKKIIGGSD